jgi:hypothetical protein
VFPHPGRVNGVSMGCRAQRDACPASPVRLPAAMQQLAWQHVQWGLRKFQSELLSLASVMLLAGDIKQNF